MSLRNETTRRAFAQKLNALMGERSLTPKQVADRMSAELRGEKFNVVNLSHYRAGRSLPRPRYLKALSAAVGVPADTLLTLAPEERKVRRERAGIGQGSVMRVDGLPNGQALLRINKRLSWPTVLRVLQVLQEA